MRFRLAELCVVTAICTTVLTDTAFAQAALDESSAAAPAAEPAAPPPEDPSKNVDYGVGLRLRNVRIPQGELELFTERAPGGTSNFGIGVDFTRRRGNVELQIGIERERITVPEGVFIESGKNVPADEADYIVDGSDLGWVTFEFTFLNHSELGKNFFLRYGGGAGLGIVTGSLKRIDVVCSGGATNANPEPGCVPPGDGGTASFSPENPTGTPRKYDSIPPVFPVVNAIIGVQYRPVPKATINFEMGIRTLLFFGLSGSYFF